MTGTLRAIFELIEAVGDDPTIQVDTDELDPPSYDDVVSDGRRGLQIAPSDVDVAIDVPASCLVLLVSDAVVLVKLASGETEMAVRMFVAGGGDSSGIAVPTTTLLVSGNGESTANLRLYYLETVA